MSNLSDTIEEKTGELMEQLTSGLDWNTQRWEINRIINSALTDIALKVKEECKQSVPERRDHKQDTSMSREQDMDVLSIYVGFNACRQETLDNINKI